MPEPGIRVVGYRDTLRALNRVDKQLRKDTVKALREAAKPVLADARQHTPVRTGALASSLRISVTGRGASIGSRLPQAPVHEFGGTIRPKGAPITIARREMVTGAVARHATRIEEAVVRAFDLVARRNGFH